ncbi:MAG: cysteine desulfhydrase [Magnetovibrio sp.]|mgnify:CR=1 FL=1|nr:cysteine desulfhydrase [Magnetovibrio sp.]
MPFVKHEKIFGFPTVSLAHTPTPVEYLKNFSNWLNGPDIFIKRDDCTGLALGGNKARQLEFYLGDALSRDADAIVITGAVQSNFVRQAAAAARKTNMGIHIQLEHRVKGEDKLYMQSGNVLLNKLFGANIHFFKGGSDESDADTGLDLIAEKVREKGGSPYVIHLGLKYLPLGALGYVQAALEIIKQSNELNMQFDAILLGSGSAATHSGLLTGLRANSSFVTVYGICVRRSAEQQMSRVVKRVRQVESMLNIKKTVLNEEVVVDDSWLGKGYGYVTEESDEALKCLAQTEGILLDPVYTAKVMAGLIGLVRQGVFHKGQRILFLHTGGTPALFGYTDILETVD